MFSILADAQVATPDGLPSVPFTGIGLIAVIFCAVFLPFLVGFISNRIFHMALSFLFCLTGVAVAMLGSSVGVFGGMVVIPFAASLWLLGLGFGIIASLDNMAEARLRRAQRQAEKFGTRAAVRTSTDNLPHAPRYRMPPSPTLDQD